MLPHNRKDIAEDLNHTIVSSITVQLGISYWQLSKLTSVSVGAI